MVKMTLIFLVVFFESGKIEIYFFIKIETSLEN